MPSDTLPNDAISNLCLLIVLPIVSCLTVHIKRRLCDTHTRRPTQFLIDRHMVVSGNMLAYSSLVVWAAYLPGNAPAHLERLVVVDLLVGIHVQRYMHKAIHATDTAPYHEPGPLALAQRKRRVKLSLLVTSLTCAWCAAVSTVIDGRDGTHYDGAREYWFLVMGLPTIHAAMRTLVLDTQGCRRPSAAGNGRPSLEVATNSFTIASDEEGGESPTTGDAS